VTPEKLQDGIDIDENLNENKVGAEKKG